MRRLLATLPLLAALFPLALHAAALADTPDEQAVLAPIQAMFAGMSARDAAAIRKPTLPNGVMVLMRDGKPTQMTFEDFAARVGKPGTKKIDLAVVWAPFDFLVDDKVEHCGTDLFNLVRQNGQWLIASVADTSRNDCTGK
jgi:hypothetical protein